MIRGVTLTLALALFAATLAAAANANRVAALEQQLRDASPAERTTLLVQLSTEIEGDDMQRSWDYAQEARQAALAPSDQLRADIRIAALERRRGNYSTALGLAHDAARRARALRDDSLRGDALLVVGWTQSSLANFPGALETYRELTPLAEARGDPLFLARLHTAIGIAYAGADDPARARAAYETARQHAERANDQRALSSVLNNLGVLAVNAKDFTAAHRYHEQALALRIANGSDTRGIADSHQNLAELAVAEGRPHDAIVQIEQAIAGHAKLNLKRNLANARLTYASALLQLNRVPEALAQLESARQLADSLASPTMRERAARAYTAFYEAQGDYRAALDWARQAAAAHDEAVGERSRQRLDTLQAQFDAERRQREIATLQRDQTEKAAALATARWQRITLLAILGLGGVLAFAVANRIRTQRRAEQRILAETRAAKEAAEQAGALKSRLVNMVSHDIRGPLHNVLHFAEEARQEHDLTAIAANLELIAAETRRVSSLAQDLLDAAALEVGRLELHRAPVDLGEIVRATLGQLESSARAKAQTLNFAAGQRDDGVLDGDGPRLAQVVTNLVSNAIKYSPRGAPITLALERSAATVRLTVRDRGPGLPPADLPKLFQPFSRLSTQPTDGESTVGLGLSLAHDLVRLHGGTISVACPREGGSVFTVELPINPSSTQVT
jgi:signal transduction histidine kinase